jgi:hypothetical protein
VRQRVAEHVPFPGHDGVEHLETGDVGFVQSGVDPAGQLEQAQVDGDVLLEQVTQQEHRDRDADQRADDRQVVEEPATAACRQVAEGDAETDREDQGGERQLDRGGYRVRKLIHHGARLRERVAEVPGEYPTEESHVLDRDGIVQPERLVQRRDRRRGRFVTE